MRLPALRYAAAVFVVAAVVTLVWQRVGDSDSSSTLAERRPGEPVGVDHGSPFRDPQARTPGASALSGLDIAASIRRGLVSDDTQTTMETLDHVRRLGLSNFVPDVLNLLGHNEEKVQVRALSTLGRIGSYSEVPAMLESVRRQPSLAVTKAAVVAMGYLGDSRGAVEIRPHLESDDPFVRVVSAGALGLLGNREGLDVAIAASHSDDFALQREAILALGLIGGDQAKARLESLSADPQSLWRGQQFIALSIIELSEHPPNERVLRLGNLIGHANRAVGRWAISELGRSGDDVAVAELSRASLARDELAARAISELKMIEVRRQLMSSRGQSDAEHGQGTGG